MDIICLQTAAGSNSDGRRYSWNRVDVTEHSFIHCLNEDLDMYYYYELKPNFDGISVQ